MAAKQVYKIPDTLDKSIGDNEIALKSNDGVGLKPLPIRLLLSYVGSILICLFICLNTFVKDANILVILLFAIL